MRSLRLVGPKLLPPVLLLMGLGCGEVPGTGGAAASDPFCGPALARVDSFMATFADREWTGERYGGTAVVGVPAEMEGMNAFTTGDVGSTQNQMFVNLMTLVQYDEDLQPIPWLARAWEVREVEDGLLELTFHLRDDVLWHDGELTTAHDVAFTYLTATHPETGFPNPSFFKHYLPGEEGVSVVDAFTVSFRLHPHAEFMDPWRTVAIMPRHLLADVPPRELRDHPFGSMCPVGNGPFRFVSYAPGDRWVFEANPAFPDELGGRPYLDRYVYRVFKAQDQAPLLAELLTGGVDVHVGMSPGHATRAREEEHLRVESFPYRSVLFVAWNGRREKLADPRVRRALTMGINRTLLIQGVQAGEGVVINSGVPPVHWAFDSSLSDSLPYDPGAARSLLEAAGWVDRDGDGIRESGHGERMSLTLVHHPHQERREIAEILVPQLGEIGVEILPRELEFPVYFEAITGAERAFDGALVSFEAEFRMDERDLFHSEAIDGQFAFSGTADPELDRYLDTLQLIVDREKAIPVWRAYQNRIIAIQPYTFLYSPNRRDGVNRRIQGAVMDPRGEWATLRNWWIAPEGR